MRILHITLFKIRETILSKNVIISMIVLPLFFIYLVGNIYSAANLSRGIPIAVVDNDNSEYSKRLINLLGKESLLQISEVKQSQAYSLVKNNKVEGAYIIPQGFEMSIKEEGDPRIELIKSTSSYGANAIAEIVSSSLIRLLSNTRAANIIVKEFQDRDMVTKNEENNLWKKVYDRAESYWEPKPVMELEHKSVYYQDDIAAQSKTVGFTQGPLGLILTFIALFIGYGVNQIIKERREGTLKRLHLGCGSPLEILAANLLALFITAYMQLFLLVLLSKLLFNVIIVKSLAYSFLIFGCYILLILGVISLIASLIKLGPSFQTTYSLIIVITSIVGGCFWSIDILPSAMQFIAKLTPQGIALESFRLLALNQSALVMINCAVMLLVSVIVILISNNSLVSIKN